MVVGTHTAFHTGFTKAGAAGAVLHRMDFGVTLFFVISGFLLFRGWSRSSIRQTSAPDTKTYAVRRLLRIFPAYLPVVVVAAFVVPYTISRLAEGASWKFWITHLTLTHTYFPDNQFRGLSQMWSLATEISFYIFLPIAGYFILRKKRTAEASVRWQVRFLLVLIVIGIGGTVLRVTVYSSQLTFVGYWLPAFIDWFAIGMLYAVLHEAKKANIRTRLGDIVDRLAADPLVPVGMAICILIIASTPIAGGYILFLDPAEGFLRHYLYLAAATLLIIPGVAGQQSQGLWRRCLQSKIMVFLGTISYGIFLWHLIVLELLWRLLGWGDFQGSMLLAFPLVLLGSVILGWVSWVVIERPAIAVAHRYRPKSTPPSPQLQ